MECGSVKVRWAVDPNGRAVKGMGIWNNVNVDEITRRMPV